ncbi:DUF4191 domain-containing protein [Intrasporangium calvum]|uniref:Integral membrane protein n=1 Tax=Intrasporangium calvum (strain ATCC 23552 / DSM 43043 / JCM 3097 / NBRC 12989 / NCIMB 10167 / NRRL B-3866 / 7 KIP) TaxID=710696 RepID=E6SCF8_INTC7|nr:DUF4191 domain-containing protein [Intrasporangium calvum]ADU48537.1 integral membrane protein [Intrasporangium calvum DSM 43043]AXG13549.1 DUF4191 domain-containing protein [Intrasporangium calvum]
MARNKDGDAQAPKEKKQGRLSQILDVYRITKRQDPLVGWYMLLAFLVTFGAIFVIGLLLNLGVVLVWIFAIFGVMTGILVATIVMSRRAEAAAYRQIEGQTGAAGAALTSIRRGWYTDREPVAADVARPGDFTSAAVVYRALGRPGVVLIGEGPTGRVQKLLVAEKKRVERVAPGVPVILMRVGAGEDEVPIRKLANKVQRLKPSITKDEMAVVNKRLKALGGMKAPLPKGIDPTRARMDRKALRGK